MTLDENSWYLREYLFQQDKLEEQIMNNELSPLEISGYSFEDVVKLAREVFLGEDLTNMSIQSLRRYAFTQYWDEDVDDFNDLFNYTIHSWWTDNCDSRDWDLLESIAKEAVITSYEMHTGKGIEADESFDLDLAVEMVLE